MFEADLRAGNELEGTGDEALAAWQGFALRTRNRGLWRVIEQLDRCAFSERWRQLREIYVIGGADAVFAELMAEGQCAADAAALPTTAPPAPGELPQPLPAGVRPTEPASGLAELAAAADADEASERPTLPEPCDHAGAETTEGDE